MKTNIERLSIHKRVFFNIQSLKLFKEIQISKKFIFGSETDLKQIWLFPECLTSGKNLSAIRFTFNIQAGFVQPTSEKKNNWLLFRLQNYKLDQ